MYLDLGTPRCASSSALLSARTFCSKTLVRIQIRIDCGYRIVYRHIPEDDDDGRNRMDM